MKHRFFFVLSLLGLLAGGLSALGRSEGSIQTTWDYPGIQTLVIDADRQDVVIKAGGPRTSGRLIGDSGDEAKVTRDGSTLTLTIRSSRSWFSVGIRSARVELSVPPGMNLTLTTASGAILVQVPTATLVARSASGDIEAIRGTGSVEANSDSGTVRLKGFSGPVRASTLSGDLVLESVSGSISASTLSGNFRGTDLAPEAGSRFTTASGNASLGLRGGWEAYSVRAETVSGLARLGGKESESTISAGQGPDILVQAVSGDVQVR